jgi:hypothetical protein
MAFFELFSLVVQWAVAGLAACILLGGLFVAIQRGILYFPPRRQAIRIRVSGRRRLDRRIDSPCVDRAPSEVRFSRADAERLR